MRLKDFNTLNGWIDMTLIEYRPNVYIEPEDRTIKKDRRKFCAREFRSKKKSEYLKKSCNLITKSLIDNANK